MVCLDGNGRQKLYDMLGRRREPVFYAFDALRLDGEHLRSRPLIERKRLLGSIVPEQRSGSRSGIPGFRSTRAGGNCLRARGTRR